MSTRGVAPCVERGALAFALAVACAGCASISSVQPADTLGRGRVQFAAEPGAQFLVMPRSASPSGDPRAFTHLDLAVRYGLTERFDLGLRFGYSIVEVQGKFLFTPPGHRRVAVSFAPSVGGLVVGGSVLGVSAAAGFLNVGAPVLIGLKTRGGSELVLGPRLHAVIPFAGPTSSSSSGGIGPVLLGAGGSIGFALRVSDSFALVPEVSYVHPVYGAVAATSQEAVIGLLNYPTVQFKVGVLVGGMRPVAGDEGEAPPPPPPPAAAPAATPPAAPPSSAPAAPPGAPAPGPP